MRCPITYAKIAKEIHKTAALLGLPFSRYSRAERFLPFPPLFPSDQWKGRPLFRCGGSAVFPTLNYQHNAANLAVILGRVIPKQVIEFSFLPISAVLLCLFK